MLHYEHAFGLDPSPIYPETLLCSLMTKANVFMDNVFSPILILLLGFEGSKIFQIQEECQAGVGTRSEKICTHQKLHDLVGHHFLRIMTIGRRNEW